MANANQLLIIAELAAGLEFRHSVTPPVTDFVSAVPGAELLGYLTQWHAQGLMFATIPNDNKAVDSVPNRWKFSQNGLLWAKLNKLFSPTLTSIAPATAVHNTPVTLACVGTLFDLRPVVNFGATVVPPTGTWTRTNLSASVPATALPSAGTIQVTVTNSDGQSTGQKPFTVT